MSKRVFTLLASVPLVVAQYSTFKPYSAPVSELVGNKNVEIMSHLVNDGIVSISFEDNKFQVARKETLLYSTLCSNSMGTTAKTSFFDDGTQRSTLATTTSMSTGAAPFDSGVSEDCLKFQQSSLSLRQIVDETSLAFSSYLNTLLEGNLHTPIFSKQDGGSYETFMDVVLSGNHLEHFHSYKSKESYAPTDVKTIDYHTDQGLFIAIVPAAMVSIEDRQITDSYTGDFLIKLFDGTEVRTEFDDSSLVFMLGDGVNQYINDKLIGDVTPLRAVPHALIMPSSNTGQESRSWFGRMFLPPQDALMTGRDITYGQLKNVMVQEQSDQTLSIGCSQQSAPSVLSRKLAAESCDTTNSIWCWMRCMSFTPTANPGYCAANNSGFNCSSDFADEIYRPAIDSHGAYQPRCTNSTKFVSVYPTAYSPTSTCSLTVDSVIKSGNYTHRIQVNNVNTTILWKKVGNEVAIALVRVNTKVGWMGFGLNNPGGNANGMFGGSVVLASINDGVKSLMGEYQISTVASVFSMWNTPLPETVSNKELQISNCGAVMKFQGSQIGGKVLSMTGENTLMYAMDTKYNGLYKTFEGKDWLFYHGQERQVLKFRFSDDQYNILNPVTAPVINGGALVHVSAALSLLTSGIMLSLLF